MIKYSMITYILIVGNVEKIAHSALYDNIQLRFQNNGILVIYCFSGESQGDLESSSHRLPGFSGFSSLVSHVQYPELTGILLKQPSTI